MVLPGEFNKSITVSVKKWNLTYQTELNDDDTDFVIVDISQPEHLAHFIKLDRITELYDHHFGYENVWKEKISAKVTIEKVGSCATLIWEEYKKRGFSDSISKLSANLLYTAIISNTLNFKASVTDKRDTTAFNDLKGFIDLPKNWIEDYFTEQEDAVLQDPVKEIKLDTHVEKFPDSDEKLIIGQIELWDSSKFIKNYKSNIKEALESFCQPLWFLTSPSISEGKNYIYSENAKVQKMLEEKLDIKFSNNLATTNKLLLRKEIKRIIYNY